MDNNEQENEMERGFTNIDTDETKVTDNNIINLSESTNKEENIGVNGGFTAPQHNVDSESGVNGGFVINVTESKNTSSMNNSNNSNNNNNNNNNNNININNNPTKVRTVVKTVKSKSSFDITNKKTLISIIVGIVIFIVVLILLLVMLLGNSGKASDALPKRSSKYYKICTGTLESSEIKGAVMEMAFGVYQSEGIPKEDIVIVWSSKKGKIKADGVEQEEEAVNAFASYTSMMLDLGGEAITNKSNYLKKGKVYVTSTIEFSTSEYSSASALANDLQRTLGLKCK